jgi:hypothetical protein
MWYDTAATATTASTGSNSNKKMPRNVFMVQLFVWHDLIS